MTHIRIWAGGDEYVRADHLQRLRRSGARGDESQRITNWSRTGSSPRRPWPSSSWGSSLTNTTASGITTFFPATSPKTRSRPSTSWSASWTAPPACRRCSRKRRSSITRLPSRGHKAGQRSGNRRRSRSSSNPCRQQIKDLDPVVAAYRPLKEKVKDGQILAAIRPRKSSKTLKENPDVGSRFQLGPRTAPHQVGQHVCLDLFSHDRLPRPARDPRHLHVRRNHLAGDGKQARVRSTR